MKRLETGKLGASFDVVVQLADALDVDAGVLFESGDDSSRKILDDLVFKLSEMPDEDLLWLTDLVNVYRKR